MNNRKKTKKNIIWLHTAHPEQSMSLEAPKSQIDLTKTIFTQVQHLTIAQLPN